MAVVWVAVDGMAAVAAGRMAAVAVDGMAAGTPRPDGRGLGGGQPAR
jgi:hypothetical protein